MVDVLVFGAFAAVYITVIFLLSFLAYRKTKKGEDFLLAGRKVHPFVIGLSYGSTFISTSAIVGFGGVAAQLGMGVIWLTVLCIGVGVLIAFIVYGKRTRRIGQKLGAVTLPDLLAKRYGSNFLQYGTSIIVLASMPLYSSAVLIGGSRFIETALGVDYNTALLGFALITAIYVVFGGILAVMYTDAFQGGIMVFGMCAILIITYALLGGVTEAHQSLTGMSSLVPAGLAGAGMTGWASMPELGSPIWITLVTTIIMGVGIGVLAQPQLVIRYMTARDDRSLNRAIPIGGLFILLSTGVAFTVGALTNVYFMRENGVISTTMVQGNIDQIIPLFISSAMPEYIVVLFMLTLLAAAMSTLSALFHTMGSAAGHDLWAHLGRCSVIPAKYRKEEDCPSTLKANRIGTAVMILVSVALAFIMPGSIIARATAMFMGLSAAAFLPLFTHALFSERPSVMAAKLSLVAGASSWFLWTAFVHVKESSVLGISNFLFGSDAVLASPWTVVDPWAIALPISIVALFVGIALDRTRTETRLGEK
ncbi:MAG: sodium:solute symporter family protein [Methanomassiliicoccales archaeon]|nr:sodium:solute symporter family protein [Methanomassiliicoccales archaeon]